MLLKQTVDNRLLEYNNNNYNKQQILSVLFSKTEHSNNIKRLNILASIIYHEYIKKEWKYQIISIVYYTVLKLVDEGKIIVFASNYLKTKSL